MVRDDKSIPHRHSPRCISYRSRLVHHLVPPSRSGRLAIASRLRLIAAPHSCRHRLVIYHPRLLIYPFILPSSLPFPHYPHIAPYRRIAFSSTATLFISPLIVLT